MFRTEHDITKNWRQSNSPLVSVVCTTYNHAPYIAQTIEGFLIQETNFPIEIIIHDDASTDNTQDIIKKYAESYPTIIKPVLQAKNIWQNEGISPTFTIAFPMAQGKYIAWCEGDDYWTDPLKIQKQVDFLEDNPDFAGCFHRVQFIYEEENRNPALSNTNQKEVVTFEDLVLKNSICTASFIYRNKQFAFPDWLKNSSVSDWTLFLLVANCGKLRFLEETMGVYRIHSGGLWTAADITKRVLTLISIFKMCRRHFYPRANGLFLQRTASFYKKLLFNYFKADSYKDYRKHYLNCVLLARHFKNRYFIHATIWYLLSYSPFLATRYKQFKNI